MEDYNTTRYFQIILGPLGFEGNTLCIELNMCRFDQSMATQFFCHFVWCIARFVAQELELELIEANYQANQALSAHTLRLSAVQKACLQ